MKYRYSENKMRLKIGIVLFFASLSLCIEAFADQQVSNSFIRFNFSRFWGDLNYAVLSNNNTSLGIILSAGKWKEEEKDNQGYDIHYSFSSYGVGLMYRFLNPAISENFAIENSIRYYTSKYNNEGQYFNGVDYSNNDYIAISKSIYLRLSLVGSYKISDRLHLESQVGFYWGKSWGGHDWLDSSEKQVDTNYYSGILNSGLAITYLF